MPYLKEIEIERKRTVKSTKRSGKKSLDTWDGFGLALRFRFKESEEPDDYKIWIQKHKIEIDNIVEIASSQYFNSEELTNKRKEK